MGHVRREIEVLRGVGLKGNVRNQNNVTGMKKVFDEYIRRLDSHVSLKIHQHKLDKLRKKE